MSFILLEPDHLFIVMQGPVYQLMPMQGFGPLIHSDVHWRQATDSFRCCGHRFILFVDSNFFRLSFQNPMKTKLRNVPANWSTSSRTSSSRPATSQETNERFVASEFHSIVLKLKWINFKSMYFENRLTIKMKLFCSLKIYLQRLFII